MNPKQEQETNEETFKDRLIKEHDELKDKYLKLSAFLERPDVRSMVGAVQFTLLSDQKSYMGSYLNILDIRINLLN